MCEPNEDCYKPVGTVETQYPKEKCVNCNDDPNCPESTPLSYTPQACIKVKNGILFSCSATVDGCEKTVKIYNGANEVVFQGTYTAANGFISTQENGTVLLAVEFILCPEDSQTESNPVCFEVYTESDEKFIRESCDCCNSDMRVSDSYVATSCEECAVINFEPLFDGRHDIDEVVISETNPVTNGTLSAIGGSKYLFKFCPADGFSGTTDFGFTIKDTKGNVSTEKTVYVEVKECPEPEVPCSETTVSVQIIDVNTDIPITALSYPIGVFSPFSTSSGTGGKIGDAASYAEIISLLNDDTNKPENIVFSADGTGPNINVTGTCDFAPIKLGENYSAKTKNGISGNGNTGNEIKLGGELTEDTIIEGEKEIKFAIKRFDIIQDDSGENTLAFSIDKTKNYNDVSEFDNENNYVALITKNSNFDAGIVEMASIGKEVRGSGIRHDISISDGSRLDNNYPFFGYGTVNNLRLNIFNTRSGGGTVEYAANLVLGVIYKGSNPNPANFTNFAALLIEEFNESSPIHNTPTTHYGVVQLGIKTKNILFGEIFMLPNLPVYADNAAATSGGLPTGALYRTSTGDLKVKY